MRGATTTLSGHAGSVPTARRFVVATLRGWGLEETGWAAAPIVSELATHCNCTPLVTSRPRSSSTAGACA